MHQPPRADDGASVRGPDRLVVDLKDSNLSSSLSKLPEGTGALAGIRSGRRADGQLRVVLDLITVKFLLSYSTRPVQIFGLIGFAMGIPGAAILAWLAFIRLTGQAAIGDRPLLLFGILLVFTGVQLVTLGLLAEMQARTYHESQKKPTYVIREVLEESPGTTSG